MFGTFITTIADASHIVLENTVPISLERGTVIDILNNVMFRVVDVDTLRLYPVTRFLSTHLVPAIGLW